VVLLATACDPPSRYEGPKAAPAAEVGCSNCYALSLMDPTDILAVNARWTATCTRWDPEPLSDTHAEDERQWTPTESPCERRPFRATVSCDRACDVTPFRKQAVSAEDAFFQVRPHGSGPITISVDLRRDDTGETFHWTSTEVFVFGVDEITALCFDPAAGDYQPCATRSLDPAQPYFTLAVRTGATWAPLHVGLIGRRSSEDVWREMHAHGELDSVRDGELEKYSLRTVLGVDPVPPGDYHLTFEVMSTTIERTVRVARVP
jgi:hypothetical protein